VTLRRPAPSTTHRVRGVWPLWVRVVVLVLVAASVAWALVLLKTPALWPKALVVAAGLVLMTGWWQGHRRHGITVEMDRRARDRRRRPR
jgi:hypothetical protein